MPKKKTYYKMEIENKNPTVNIASQKTNIFV